MKSESGAIETLAIHAGEPKPRVGGAVVMPIFQSSTYEYLGEADYHDVRYIRLNNNPNQVALCKKIAAIENTEAALVAGSGMAAISAALLTVLSGGDHFIALDCLYSGTHELATKILPGYGISHSFVNGNDHASWERALKPNTKAIYVETLTNPLLQVTDLARIVEFARANNLVSLIDNTFASPINYRPADHGFDIVLESCTKYLNGHDDLVAGAVAGDAERIRPIKHKLDILGGTLDPHACFLLDRGLKTLAVRVRHQNASALRIATFLSQHVAVQCVNYPGLSSHEQHERAAELFTGFGGMISFEIKGGAESADRMFERLRIPALAVSLGGVESLIIRPAAAIHPNLSAEQREASGISDGLIRLSVGLEATDDLIADFEHALAC